MEIGGVREPFILPDPPPVKNDYLDQAAFLRLLTVQLATQNPLEPMNDRDFFAQLAQLGTVQGVAELKQSMQVAQGAALIGRTVEVFSPLAENGTVRGVVEAVEMANRKVYIHVGGGRYDIGRLMRILA